MEIKILIIIIMWDTIFIQDILFSKKVIAVAKGPIELDMIYQKYSAA